MTEQEKQEIILAVLGGLKVHSMTIDQLTESTTVGDSDYIELNGGRKISFKKFSELVLGQIAENIRMKANLNTQNALATGEEQRLVIRIIEKSERPVILRQGVYYNENSQLIETYVLRDMHGSSVLRMVLSEEPSKNVVYCDEDTNTLFRWDGSEMVKVGGGGGGDVGDAYTKAESDKRFAKLSNTHQVISLGYALFGNEEYEVRVDGEGIMWVNGERVVTTDDETQHVFAELVKAVTVKVEEVWLGDNEDVLTTVDGKLKLNGESVVEIVQEQGNATDKVMSQDAVTKALASAGGDWELVADVTTSERVKSIQYDNLPNYSELIIFQPTSQGFFEDESGASKASPINVDINSVKNGYGYQLKTPNTTTIVYPRKIFIQAQVVDGHVSSLSCTQASAGGAQATGFINFDLESDLKFDFVKIEPHLAGLYISQGIHIKIYGKK